MCSSSSSSSVLDISTKRLKWGIVKISGEWVNRGAGYGVKVSHTFCLFGKKGVCRNEHLVAAIKWVASSRIGQIVRTFKSVCIIKVSAIRGVCKVVFYCTIWLFSAAVSNTTDVCFTKGPPPCSDNVLGTWGRCVSQSKRESHSAVVPTT